ncbi:polysaccharide biosynthesis/export family protein [Piscinibacter terrae]|uniref:Sugar transporter n=1 Tax=Piscinibacter terrae TaxID=2496871 RepID=A0A3N7JT46_9BURK|nr:SLBB domain-containing protein [Albitalea terrae]RQP24119.1 sugar transporter [Albitalea terrae]
MRAFHFLLALCLSSGAALAQTSSTDKSSGGTFVSPGYPTARSPQGLGTQAPNTNGTSNPSANDQSAPGLRMPPALRGNPAQSPDDDQNQSSRRLLKPTKPSEFQRFVEDATGRLLPVFGADFFSQGLAGPSTVDNVPVSGDYIIGPGDELMIRAWGSIDVDYRAVVDRNGQVNLPKVGSFNVAGVHASEIDKHLRAQIGRVFTNFNLSVTLGHLRGVKVFVVGPAQQPGVYTLASQSTILSAVVAAGGPGPNGSMRRVLLRRDGKLVSELDAYDFLVQGDKSKDIQLQAGDVVVFQPVGPRVALTGALETPGIYELKSPQESLREVLRYAGGAPVLANQNRGQLERIDPGQPKARVVEEFKLDTAGMQKPLRDGDVVTLLEISPEFANAVTLKGHVAQPLRYPYKPGMRVSDLIPDKDALISPDFYRRKNLLVQVIDEQEDETPGHGSNGQATVPGSQVPDSSGSRIRKSDQRDAVRAAAERAKKTPSALFDELNWDYAVVERLSTTDISTQVIPFNLGKAVLQHDPLQDIQLLPGDVVTIYSQKDIRVPTARQTRLVSLEGEVKAPGVYQLMPGETLKSLLTRIGGLTPQAYVYGLEFSREETRQRQRENLQSAMQRLQALSATQAARTAANARDDAADRSTSVSQAATQAQMARLAQLQPNGRIALELPPDATSVDSLPDVPLEHGDHINVPSRPGFVTVAGAVLNNNGFLWKPGRTAGDYVRLAGLDEAADRSNMFILRADGTVSSANDRRGFFSFGGVESQVLQPGDAVIVPNQLDYETWGRALVRNLKDWSQIFSQFGLGAAAIKTLRN